MNVTIVSTGKFGEVDIHPEIDFEIFVETDSYKTHYKLIDSAGLVEELNKFAEQLKQFPFEDKSPVTLNATHSLTRIEKLRKTTPDGILFKAYLANAMGDTRLFVETRDSGIKAYASFEATVDSASLQRLSRGLLSTNFNKKVIYTWNSNQTD